jgi:alcohol dehydrogenase, propanol-preferring
MRAMFLHNAMPIEAKPLLRGEAPDPVPGPHEVRVSIRCCAVCRTDLHIAEGDIRPPALPIIPGHQIVGIVDALGLGCQRSRLGMRVGVAWLRHTCGACRFCASGRENLCELSRYTGFHADGGFAQYAVAPEEFIYELPDKYDDITAAPLLCAGIIGYRAFKRCNLRSGGTLGIFGFGSSAHIILPIARSRGHEVFVVTRSQGHQALARNLGASWCGADAAHLPVRLDAAIVFAPAGEAVSIALGALDRGGTVALAGIHMTPIPALDYDKYLFGERDIHPVTANTRQDGHELLVEAAMAGIRPRTRSYPLSDANSALRDLKEGHIDGTGVLIVEG